MFGKKKEMTTKQKVLEHLGLGHLENVDEVKIHFTSEQTYVHITHRPNTDKLKGVVQQIESFKLTRL